MSRMKEIDEIAQGIADVTKEIMYDSIHWQIEDQLTKDGVKCEANHSEKGWVEVTIYNKI